MRRRDINDVLGVAFAWPLGVRAQQADRVRRLSVLLPYAENDAEAKSHLSALTQETQTAGVVAGPQYPHRRPLCGQLRPRAVRAIG